jgi:hypothetical protein
MSALPALAIPRFTRLPRLDAGLAAGAGLRAGAIFLAVLLASSVILYDEPPWKVLRMIAATAMGASVLEPSDVFDLRVIANALALHLGACVMAAAVVAALVAALPRLAAAWVGLAFGAALYVADAYVAAAFFPWLAELGAADTLAAHLLFGMLAAQGYADRATASRSTWALENLRAAW